MNIITQLAKTSLFQTNDSLVKKNDEGELDVRMVCYDETEICELVVLTF